MRGSNQRGPRLAVTFDASCNIHAFHVNRNGYEMTASEGEHVSCQAISRLFHPHTTSRVQEYASRDLECLLRTSDNHELLRFAA